MYETRFAIQISIPVSAIRIDMWHEAILQIMPFLDVIQKILWDSLISRARRGWNRCMDNYLWDCLTWNDPSAWRADSIWEVFKKKENDLKMPPKNMKMTQPPPPKWPFGGRLGCCVFFFGISVRKHGFFRRDQNYIIVSAPPPPAHTRSRLGFWTCLNKQFFRNSGHSFVFAYKSMGSKCTQAPQKRTQVTNVFGWKINFITFFSCLLRNVFGWSIKFSMQLPLPNSTHNLRRQMTRFGKPEPYPLWGVNVPLNQ